jgi:hypothetical protein
MSVSDKCANQCSLSASIGLEEPACADGHCELQAITDAIFEEGWLTKMVNHKTAPNFPSTVQG